MRPAISRSVAIRDALAQAPWKPSTATGSILIALATRVGHFPIGLLAWAVSVKPKEPVFPFSCGPDPLGLSVTSRGSCGRPDTFFSVIVSARTGRLVEAEAG
jgi:hypothetical protein